MLDEKIHEIDLTKFNGEVYFTSDLHFGHTNIIKYCNRPYKSVHEMNKNLTLKWNDVVNSGDTVIILGDFTFKNPELYLKNLNGYHILIKGNHDKSKYMDRFDESYFRASMKIGKWNVFLHHKPIEVVDKFDKRQVDEKTVKISKQYDFVICGHVHEKWQINKKNINIGVDVWNFQPVHINKLEDTLNKIILP